jgi:hypothetical protein
MSRQNTAHDLAEHVLAGRVVTFTKASGTILDISYVRDIEVCGLFYLQIADAAKKRNITCRYMGRRDVENYISGLCDAKQREMTGDSYPCKKA